MVTFGALESILGGLGRSLGAFRSHLVSFWVPWASKIDTTSDVADIAKTCENLLFFIGFGGLGGDS